MKTTNFNELIKYSQVHCPCCNKSTICIADLPKYPLTEFFRDLKDTQNPYGHIDQEIRFCTDCNHMFLRHVMDANQIYRNDNYITSSILSRGAVVCIENFVNFIKKSIADLSQYTIIDIGGNDSTLLEYFLTKCKKLINIDPNASTSNQAIEIHKSFLEEIDFTALKDGQSKIFVSSHTIEHLEDPAKLLRSLSLIVTNNDFLYLQFPSLELLIEQKRFDQICHQHINYFSLNSIMKIMEQVGLQVNDYEFDSSHFGTLRVLVTRRKTNDIQSLQFTDTSISDSYCSFRRYCEQYNHLMKDFLYQRQGFGAGLMVPTLAYYLPLINNLSKIVDDNPMRIGKRYISLIPPIVGMDELDVDKPVLITSISTKIAARAIFTKLVSLGVNDICLPTMVT